MTTRPASSYFAAHALMYGSARRLLIQEYVQKLTSTTLPRSDLLLNGVELSQATAPFKSGIRPSSPVPDAIATTPLIRAVAEIQRTKFFIRHPQIASASPPAASRQAS